MKLSSFFKISVCSLALIVGSASISHAGSPGPNDEILRKEGIVDFSYKDAVIEDKKWDEEPVRKKTFKFSGISISPSIEVDGKYIDNIYATDSDEKSDFVSTLRPALSLNGDFKSLSVNANIETEINRHAKNDSEDNNNFNVGLGLKFKPATGVIIPVNVIYENGYKNRDDNFSNNIISMTPHKHQMYGGNIGIVVRPDKIGLELYAGYKDFTFDNNRLLTSGTNLILNDNDMNSSNYKAIISYNFEEDTQIFAIAENENNDFERKNYVSGAYSGIDRDNNVTTALLGFRTDFKGMINNSIAIGYTKRKYDDNGIGDISTIAVRAGLNLKYKDSTKFSLSYNRGSEENYDYVYGYIVDDLSLSIDHEIIKNLYITTDAGIKWREFETINREDEQYTAGLGLKYHLTPNFYVAGQYIYDNRNSNITGFDYESNIIMLRLRAEY